jgi:hypothetical protein
MLVLSNGEEVIMANKAVDDTLVFSYLELRTAIGTLGMALPFVVSIGARLVFDTGLQESISAYYHTGMRDAFVGTLFAIGLFLLSYRGREGTRDNLVGNLACIAAVGAALFPTAPRGEDVPKAELIIGGFHFGFATLFFAALIYFCLVLFPQPDATPPVPGKKRRNRVYRACGCGMILCILLIVVYYLFLEDVASVSRWRPVFWLEAVAIFLFGVSWFTKGHALARLRQAFARQLERFAR